jgi:acid phosphatase
VVDTARYFSAGLFGLDWEKIARLHVIPETQERGGDTLTPGDTCLRYRDDLLHGHDRGANMLVEFRKTYLGKVADRLKKGNPGIRFEDEEIYSMQEMCGFETIVRGSSRWCEVFTEEEWEKFEYARDIIHFYRSG